jgi:uncharacterized repeat protein (TIGR03803 family)
MGRMGSIVKRHRAGCGLAGVVLCASCLLAAMPLSAQTFTTLQSFNTSDGAFPYAPLVQGTDGNLYGTTSSGGAQNSGTVFKISQSGTFTELYSFCLQSACADGENPEGGLVQGSDGNYYGTAFGGGAYGWGTAFKISPTGTLTTLYSFCLKAQCTDGANPVPGLVQATNGAFYGTTSGGGTFDGGAVFKITTTGALTTLYSFCSLDNCADGANPEGALIQGTNGNLYGTTVSGGANGSGTVYEITPAGAFTTLYSFCTQSGCADGQDPYSALVQDTKGNFYGTTRLGGANGVGTVFKLAPGGVLTTLYTFCPQSGCADGSEPFFAGLTAGTDGNYYGTTDLGGVGFGTLFKISPRGTFTTLYSLGSQSGDGLNPYAALIQATNGSFYGTTHSGSAGVGSVFSLSVGLSAFVEVKPSSGKVGAAVKILGTNLTGATSVTFNGTAAVFKVTTKTLISTTVPSGATSGPVRVVTSHGTLTSNVNFQVLP